MSKLFVRSFGISMDGYGAGPNQDLQNPLGVNGPELMECSAALICAPWAMNARSPSQASAPPTSFFGSVCDSTIVGEFRRPLNRRP